MGYMTDEHRNTIKLSAMEGWRKTVDLKELLRNKVNLIVKSKRCLSRSLTILMWLIRIQLRFSKAVTSWI